MDSSSHQQYEVGLDRLFLYQQVGTCYELSIHRHVRLYCQVGFILGEETRMDWWSGYLEEKKQAMGKKATVAII